MKLRIIYSAFFVAIVSALPWLLFASNTKLAMFAPVCLFIVLLIHNQQSARYSKNVVITFLLIFGFILIRLGVVAQGSQSYRLLSQIVLVSVLPLLFITTNRRKVRNLIALNIIILLFGLVAIEGTLRVINPKVNEQAKWSEIKSQFDEAPTPENKPEITITNFGRKTTDQPTDAPNRILFYGGSTTYNGEVSNRFTYASITQRLLNDNGLSFSIENHGVIGASVKDLIPMFLDKEGDDQVTQGLYRNQIRPRIKKGDIVIFYIGVNESKNAMQYRNPITRLSYRFKNFASASEWLFKKTDIGYVLNNVLSLGRYSINDEYLSEIGSDLSRANQFITNRGGIFVPVLQAHVFTRSDPLPYESAIRKSMGVFPEAIDSIYPRLAEIVLSFGNSADARKVFDQLPTSPFIDWCHVGELGNQRISEFMFQIIKQKTK
jgi:hypothetical protein